MRKRQMTLWAVRITFILLALTWQALGQAITGRLVGTIQDSSQAVVPDARVTITNSGTGISWDVQTDAQGNYVAPSLPSGTYKISVAAAGFRNAVAANVVVSVAPETRVDVTMELGKLEEILEVVGAAAPSVQSTTSDLGEVVNQRQVQTLPLNGRIFSQLIFLVPGAVPAGQELKWKQLPQLAPGALLRPV